MIYRDLTIALITEDTEKASAIALMLDLGGVYLEDYSDLSENEIVKQVGLVDEALLKKDKTIALLHVYVDSNTSFEDCVSFMEERLNSEKIKYTMTQTQIDEEDYSTSWKQYYKPIKIGEHIIVVPEWESYDATDDEIVLRIDPGLAFGTGTHETTSMCIESLQEYIKKNDKILDIGTGSGILSITALLCGAEKATAIDIDKNAVRVARENAALNGISQNLEAFDANILQDSSLIRGKKFDVIVANIVADVIIALIPKIKDSLNGFFIVSGIIGARCAEVKKELEMSGFSIVEIKDKKGWNCIVSSL